MSLQIAKLAPADQVMSRYLMEEVRQRLKQARTSRRPVQLGSPKAVVLEVGFVSPSQSLRVAAHQPIHSAIRKADLEFAANGDLHMGANAVVELNSACALTSPGQELIRPTTGDAPLNKASSSLSRAPARSASHIHNWLPRIEGSK
jgi:hypothetical protein